MTSTSPLRSTLLAASITIASTLCCGMASAQTTGLGKPPASKSSQMQDAYTRHKFDLEAIVKDLGKVKTPEVSKSYEAYLAGEMPKYTANHKTLHRYVDPTTSGKPTSEQQKVADDTKKLNETHYPTLVAEMARVEKLNPSLKKNFDELRTPE
jgi:hypothetical protein